MNHKGGFNFKSYRFLELLPELTVEALLSFPEERLALTELLVEASVLVLACAALVEL
jgi:hypothetical protein